MSECHSHCTCSRLERSSTRFGLRCLNVLYLNPALHLSLPALETLDLTLRKTGNGAVPKTTVCDRPVNWTVTRRLRAPGAYQFGSPGAEPHEAIVILATDRRASIVWRSWAPPSRLFQCRHAVRQCVTSSPEWAVLPSPLGGVEAFAHGGTHWNQGIRRRSACGSFSRRPTAARARAGCTSSSGRRFCPAEAPRRCVTSRLRRPRVRSDPACSPHPAPVGL